MKRVLLSSFLVVVLGVTAGAQENAERPQRRGGWGPGPNAGPRGGGERMYDRIASELELDEEQRARFDEITAGQRERMRGMGERWREMREAQEAGDEERVAQLRAQMGEGRGMDTGLVEALDELEPILRDDQVAKLWEIQDRLQSRDAERSRFMAIRELPDELELDEQQRQEYEEILRSGRERMRGRFEEMRPLVEEMREAAEAGDEERVAELRRQMEEARPDSGSMFDGFYEELEKILNEEQIKRLAEFRQRVEGGGPDEKRGPADVRDILRAAKRLRLDGEQKEGIRDIEREAIGAFRKIGRRDKEGQAGLAADVKADIIELLDAEQVEQFEEQLKRLGRGSRREREP